MSDVLAVDIGGTKIAAALVRPGGTVVGRRTRPTPAREGAAAVLAAAVALGREVAGESAVSAVGVGSAGVIDPVRGVVTHATDALPGWPGTDLAGGFRAAFGVPVAVLNDVHAHGLGEAAYGAGRDRSSMLLVAVGTGIGGAYVEGGRLVAGHRFVAGHVGHVAVPEAAGVTCSCGRVGHLEGLAAGPGVHAAYLRAGGAAESSYDVLRLAETEPLAREVVQTGARAIGRVVGGLVNVLDPEVVVIGGGLAAAGELWWSALRDGVTLEAMDVVADVPVVAATAGQDAALLGAATWAVRRARG